MRIYIAAPYNPVGAKDKHEAIQLAAKNVSRAIEAAIALIEKGHYPFVPHLTHYIHTHPSCPRDYGEWWYEYDMTFLDHWAEALLYLAPSKGADAELQHAKEIGLKIFYSVDEVPDNTTNVFNNEYQTCEYCKFYNGKYCLKHIKRDRVKSKCSFFEIDRNRIGD